MAKKVQVDFTANAQALYSTIKGVKKEIGSLKTAFAGAIGISSLGIMVKSAIDYAEEIANVSDQLKVSVDRAVQLTRVMKTVGKSGGEMVSAMSSVQEYMRAAYLDAYKLTQLRKLGVDRGDMQNFNFDVVLRKTLEASKKLSNAEAQMRLRELYGSAGMDFFRKRDQILQQPESSNLTRQQLQQVVELNAKFKALKDAISILILRAIIPLGESIMRIVAYKKDTEDTWMKRKAAAMVDRLNAGKQLPSDLRTGAVEGGIDTWRMVSMLTGNPMYQATEMGRPLLQRLSLMASGYSWKEANAAMQVKNKHENQKSISDLFKDYVNASANELAKPQFTRQHLDNNFLQIGGLMGIDANYRLAQFAEQTATNTQTSNEILQQILSRLGGKEEPQPFPSNK